jgi:hypothetical protein
MVAECRINRRLAHPLNGSLTVLAGLFFCGARAVRDAEKCRQRWIMPTNQSAQGQAAANSSSINRGPVAPLRQHPISTGNLADPSLDQAGLGFSFFRLAVRVGDL